MALSKKTDVRQMWEKIPFALDFKIYLFNFTNPEEINNGALPVVKEIGPYYFEEWKEKVEIEDHEEDDTITYKKKDVFYFKPELSGPGLTGEEDFVIPHLPVVGTFLATVRNTPSMVSMIGKGLNGIYEKPKDIFMRVKALDFLFRGYMINCDRTEFAPKAICAAYKKEAVPGFDFEHNNQVRFSIFGERNNSIDPHVVTVKRGITNVMEVGSVIAIDGEPEMNRWRDTCNEYGGTDGTIFPPFLTSKDRLASYSGELCRSFKPWYQKKTSYKGIKTNRYTVNIGDLANDPELNCFCSAPDKCPPKGMMDLMKCIKAPVYASLPHFLECDPEMATNIIGLSPNVEEHGIEIDFEPISGTPMVAKQRIQFSIELVKNEKYAPFKNLANVHAPVFWIEEGLALNKTFVKMLKHQLFIPKKIAGTVRWLLLLSGTVGSVCGIIFHFKGKSVENNKVTTVNSNEDNEEKVTEENKEISVIGQAQEPAKINM